jgi:hypothetical protein
MTDKLYGIYNGVTYRIRLDVNGKVFLFKNEDEIYGCLELVWNGLGTI